MFPFFLTTKNQPARKRIGHRQKWRVWERLGDTTMGKVVVDGPVVVVRPRQTLLVRRRSAIGLQSHAQVEEALVAVHKRLLCRQCQVRASLVARLSVSTGGMECMVGNWNGDKSDFLITIKYSLCPSAHAPGAL